MKCIWMIASALCMAALAFGQNGRLESAKQLQTTCSTAMKVFDEAAEITPLTQDAAEYGKCIGYVEGVLDSLKDLKRVGEDGKTYTFHLNGDLLSVKDAALLFLEFMKTDNKYDSDGSAA